MICFLLLVMVYSKENEIKEMKRGILLSQIFVGVML